MNRDYNSIVYSLYRIRGAVSVEDYPFIILPALLLQWAEIKNKKEGFASYKEIYSPSRLSATYGITDNAEQIIEYLIQIEESQKNVYGGYISEVSAVLRKVPEKDFSTILRTLSEAELSTTEQICDFAKGFIQYTFKTVGRMYANVLSASGIMQIEKMVLGETSESDTIYDGFAGTGISTITATSGHGRITLQELNVRMACIAEIMCILNGCNARINVDDSLIYKDDEEKYTKVITEPPFSYRRPDIKDMNPPYYSPDPDIMCIKHALHKTDDNGVAVVLSPAGALFKSGKTGVDREALICNGYIDTVIQFPQGSVFGTSIATALIVLRKNNKNDSIFFIDASKLLESTDKAKTDFILSQENEAVLRDIIDNRKEVEEISRIVPIKEIESHEYSLVITQYLNKVVLNTTKADIKPLVEKSNMLLNKLMDTDKELKSIRERYVV